MKAKELVNSFYQPLGLLHCGVSSNEMWEYSKERAIEWCNAFIKEFEQLAKPEYTTFITQPTEYNTDASIKSDAKTCDGYEKISLFEQLKEEIKTL